MAKKMKHDDEAEDRKLIKEELAKKGLKKGGKTKKKPAKKQ
jgi:hypothetical protein